MSPSPWTVEGHRANLALPGLAARLDLRRPWRGLHEIECDGDAFASVELLRLESKPGSDEESIVDQYIREHDLVVNYAQTAEQPVALQLHWRAWSDDQGGPCIGGVDLLVSMQTDRLEAYPTLRIANDLPREGMLERDERIPQLLFRPHSANGTLLIVAHPSDCRRTETLTTNEGQHRIVFQPYQPRLEKGVIRRARLRAAFLPREGDEQAAAACREAFLKAPLPLTT